MVFTTLKQKLESMHIQLHEERDSAFQLFNAVDHRSTHSVYPDLSGLKNSELAMLLFTSFTIPMTKVFSGQYFKNLECWLPFRSLSVLIMIKNCGANILIIL